MTENRAHGMALEIRALRDSEEFDLAGYDSGSVAALMTASFSQPIQLPAGHMVRVSFIIGGGKKVRQKYPETLSRDISAALTSLGFEDDRGASCVLACQGSFKYQHDTDKDLIKMHVFPRVEALPEKAEETDTTGGDMPGDCARLIVSEELNVFKELVDTNAPSFIQKKSLLKVMKGVATRFEAFDAKLINMEPLEPDEQELYSRGIAIADKVEWLEGALQSMIKKGQLTKGEQVFMVAEFQNKIDQVESAIAAQKEKGKKTEKMEAVLEDVKAKRDEVAALEPLPAQKGSNNKELEELRKRLKKLNLIEGKKGLLSPEEASSLARKPQIEERLKKMEEGDSSGWFDSKVKEMEALVAPKKKAPAKTSSSSGGSGGGSYNSARPVSARSSAGGWSSTAASRGGGRVAAPTAKKNKQPVRTS
mmetsp:Transcript_44184/g.84459  ORF Transcript_44184/g.84459 Transcript_44184/m.84459 type:complete len:421 (-) Transcript_44184:205-1467(-)